MSRPGPHPACLPDLALVYALTANLVPLELMNGLLELCLSSVYEPKPPPNLTAWLERLARVEPRPASFSVAQEIGDKVRRVARVEWAGLRCGERSEWAELMRACGVVRRWRCSTGRGSTRSMAT